MLHSATASSSPSGPSLVTQVHLESEQRAVTLEILFNIDLVYTISTTTGEKWFGEIHK